MHRGLKWIRACEWYDQGDDCKKTWNVEDVSLYWRKKGARLHISIFTILKRSKDASYQCSKHIGGLHPPNSLWQLREWRTSKDSREVSRLGSGAADATDGVGRDC